MTQLIVKKLKDEIRIRLSRERATHSLNVGKLAQHLCSRYNVAPEKGLIAGLAHDLAREWEQGAVLALLREHQVRISPWERRHPLVLHGKAGAILLETLFDLKDQEILDAVRDHVLGRRSMGLLSRIIFVADFLEPGRGFIDEQTRLRILADDLSGMLVRVAELVFAFLKAENKSIAWQSRRMLAYFKKALRRNRR